jgi:hypothetical protein
MKSILASVLAVALVITVVPRAEAETIVEDGHAMYVGGTAAKVKPEALGKLDTTQPKSLEFQSPDGNVSIPYASIESYEYTRKLARHLGAVATVAVVLVKHLQRKHFLTITYRDEAGAAQVAVFEIAKELPESLLPILQARAPQGCKTCPRPAVRPAARTGQPPTLVRPEEAVAQAR